MLRRQVRSGPIADSPTSTSAIGAMIPLKNGGPTLSSVPCERLGDQREERAPEDHDADQDQREVVEQEEDLARQERVDARLRAEVVAAADDQRDRRDERARDEDEERLAERRLAEGVDRVEDAGAHEEGPEQRQHERRDDQGTFQIRSMPRFSWTMIEWMNAVPVSHGISDAFSTGSHAQ